tara:strand:+ start:149 stop:838 length:690 start_codon:yes stop_codon:yes gene_type:complete
MTEKRDIQKLVDQESEKFYEFLDPNDVKDFKALTEELRDTWTKKQVFRTETEMRFSVLNDLRYPNNASKYWQCVREQDVYLEQMMKLSFEYRRNEAKIKKLKKLLDKETDEYKKEVYEIDLDDRNFSKANMQLVARDRMREIKLWSKLKAEVDDGTFDTQNVNTHQLEAYHQIMINRKDTLSPQSSQPEVFNVLGQLQTIERVQKEKAQLESKKREALSSESTLGAKPE